MLMMYKMKNPLDLGEGVMEAQETVDHFIWRGTNHALKYLLGINSSNSFKMPAIQ